MAKARLSFKEWLVAVNNLCYAKAGMGVDDGADWPSRDTYDDGGSVLKGYQVWRKWQDQY